MAVTVRPHASLEALFESFSTQLLHAFREQAGAGELPRPLPVIVPAGLFADWLRIRLAREHGISMGLEFIRPQQFVSRIASLVDAQEPPSTLDPWTRDSLAWYLLPHVPSVAGELGLPTDKPLAPREAFATARTIADHLEHYGHSRPELIKAWRDNRPAPIKVNARNANARAAEAWQRRLWKAVSADIAASPHARPHPGLVLLETGEAAAQRGVEHFRRVFVLGTGGLEPLLVKTLARLSAAGAEVFVDVVLPTMDYLEDFKPAARRAPLLEDPESEITGVGNALVAALGTHAIGSFCLLGDLDQSYSQWPEAGTREAAPNAESEAESDEAPSLLKALQTQIRTPVELFDAEGAGIIPAKQVLSSHKDHSLLIHACHGPRREIEVLRDELLRAFDEIPGLRPEEVLVLCPDLETYAPLATAILKGGTPSLPVRLTEQAPGATAPLLDALARLLAYAQSRQEASGLIALVALPRIQEALGIAESADALERIQNWIRHSGMTSGLDAAARAALGLPEDPVGTLRFAQDRLLAGMLLGDEAAARDAAGEYVHPLAGSLDTDLELRDRFTRWLEALANCLNEWKQPATAAVWADRLTRTLDTLLCTDVRDNDTGSVRQHLAFLAAIDVAEVVDAGAIEDWLAGLMEATAAARSQLSGDICIGRFKQLSQLPCRVLAILGLQDGDFPRQTRTPSWDLLQLAPTPWDRNPRIEDRQMFLDALLTPSERLIITAPTQNVRSGKTEPFSSCVDELLRHVGDHFTRLNADGSAVALRETLVIKHRLQPFAENYFPRAVDTASGVHALPASYDVHAAKVASLLARTRVEGTKERPFQEITAVLPPANTPAANPDTLPATPTLGDLAHLELAELISFWTDPARAWVRAQGIVLPQGEEDDTQLDRAPLGTDSLMQWALKDAIIEAGLSGTDDAEQVRSRLTADRTLPAGALGRIIWDKQRLVPERIARLLAQCRQADPLPVSVAVPVDARTALTLEGSLTLGLLEGTPCLLLYRAGVFNSPKRALGAWIQHLAACAGSPAPLPALLIDDNTLALDPGELRPAIPAQEALGHLSLLVAGFLLGRVEPLSHAPASSSKYEKGIQSSDTPDPVVLARALGEAWEDGYNRSGEASSPAARLAWRGRDPRDERLLSEWHFWSGKVSRPAQKWFETTVNSPKRPNT